MSSIVRVSEKDLEKALAKTRLSEKNRQVAYRIFVEGAVQNQVAEELGESRSNVNAIVIRVRRRLEELLTDSAWVQARIELPKSLVDELALFAKSLRRGHGEGAQKDAVEGVVDAIARARGKLATGKKS